MQYAPTYLMSTTLSRTQLTSFLACQRQFHLRFQQRLPWPQQPLEEKVEANLSLGQTFHQLLERHFLGLDVAAEAMASPRLRNWWLAFKQFEPSLPNGRFLPELTLTTPLLHTDKGSYLLNGRFDLLIVSEDSQSTPFAHLFDWKTGRPRPESSLRHDWQTRLYLAMLAESSRAILGTAAPLAPDQIAITYWYVSEPDAPRTLRYSTAQHAQNWADLQAIAAQMDAASNWPRTDDLTLCLHCPYQAYCGRQTAVSPPPEPPEEDDYFPEWLPLEPIAP